ncbi:MAG: MTAP family purine nucleoside phosphorylase [Spirochaetia bacterium]|jgi:purine nucleoside phosphorylase|nr:MTAP family purine nucleoside phosphorylase [Spirochaetia bacterium]
MRAAILGGTGVYSIEGIQTVEETVETEFGPVVVMKGTGQWEDLYFISRHGTDHSIPPHMINYRANIQALKNLAIDRVLAIYAVGSITDLVPPGEFGLVTQFIDATQGRINSFYNGGKSGLKHTPMDEPYCGDLGSKILASAKKRNLSMAKSGTYLCTNGPRLETPAEIKMYKMWGADHVGMTGATETVLAREAGLHYVAVAYSINWAAGMGDIAKTNERKIWDGFFPN